MTEINENLNEITTTTETLTRLESELSDLGKKMALAADDADSASLITLAHRRNDLPIEILSARIILERLYLRRDELRLPEIHAEVGRFYEPIQEAIRKRDAAVLELGKLQGASHAANEDLREAKTRTGERRRSIESLLAQARNVKIVPTSLQMHGGR